VHDDDRALLGLEPLEGGIEQVAVGNDGRDVADDRCITGSSSTSIGRRPRRRITLMQDRKTSAMQPRLEAIGIAQAGQTAPGGKEPFLDRVSRELVVPKESGGPAASSRATKAPASAAKAS
jgi:hypothetical protein